MWHGRYYFVQFAVVKEAIHSVAALTRKQKVTLQSEKNKTRTTEQLPIQYDFCWSLCGTLFIY